MEELKGKLVFIQLAGGETVIPSSGVLAVVEDVSPDVIKVKEAAIFALLPTAQGTQATLLPLDPTSNEPVVAYINKAQVVSIVPVSDKSKLKEFHQQFKAAAAGIELPTSGAIDVSKLKQFPQKGGKGGLKLS